MRKGSTYNTNTYEIKGDVLYIRTIRGEEFIADADKFDLLKNYCWCQGNQCAESRIYRRSIKMHRFVLGDVPPEMHVRHINGNNFDNRISNLAVCTKEEMGRIRSERRNECKYIREGDILTIITANGERIIADAENEEKLRRHSWCVSKTGYPVANIKGVVTKMHLYLFGTPPKGFVTDHINRDKFDNRQCNLRICTEKENARNAKISKNNTSGATGVRITPTGRFSARIMVDRKNIALGTYDTFEEAKAARIKGELKYFGDFAPCLSGE